ncbi:MAG: YceD family protein [Chitinophagaceae bacterium]
MSNRREYEIAFVGLKPGVHIFEYDVNDKFFEDFQEQDFKDCKAHVKLHLDKSSSTFMMLRFEMGGSVDVTCDRCSNNLPLQLFDEFTVTVKMVENPEVANDQEEDPDVYYISKGESHLDVKGWIYEFINLSIPMTKTCEYENMDGPYCSPEARELLNRMRAEKEEKENPIWKDLKGKFKDLQ